MAASLNKGKKGAGKTGRAGTAAAARKVPELQEIEQKLIEKLGTKVEVHGTTAKGRIEISYFSAEDLERLLETRALWLEAAARGPVLLTKPRSVSIVKTAGRA
jgi:hypothetical protein